MAGLHQQVKLLASVPLMIEYQAVLSRSKHLEAAGISVEDVEVLLDALSTVATPVRLAFLWRPAVKDPDDDMVLETAVNGRADAIVTFNVRDFRGVAGQFGIEVLSPGAALARLEN